jgi:hypothetical protein
MTAKPTGIRLPETKEKEMKITKILGAAAVAALALMAFAGTASATTLANEGAPINKAVTIHATAESSILLSATGGGFANTCTESTVLGTTTTPFSGARVGGEVATLSFGNCANPVTVHKGGYLEIENITLTTNGTVFSKNAEVTTGSPFGTLTCKTAASGTHIGTFTGGVVGTMDINAVLNCGFFLPSAKWEGKYSVTSGPNTVEA